MTGQSGELKERRDFALIANPGFGDDRLASGRCRLGQSVKETPNAIALGKQRQRIETADEHG
jgi:hypothetical protein